MTICVAVKVHDCIVFAADSASSLVDTDHTGRALVANVYSHGNKVFNLRKGLPIAAMTCGMGNVGPVSIGTLAKDLRQRFCSSDPAWRVEPDDYSIEDIARKARNFFFEEHYAALDPKPGGDHEFQFWIGGNGSGKTHGEIWRVKIVNGSCDEPECLAGEGDFDILYDGQPEAINRIVNGYSQYLPQALLDIGLQSDKLDAVLTHIDEVDGPHPTASSRAMMVLLSTISKREPPTWRLPRSASTSPKTSSRFTASTRKVGRCCGER